MAAALILITIIMTLVTREMQSRAIVPDKFITGTIQRGTVAQRTIQKLTSLRKRLSLTKLLFDKLHSNPVWEPEIDIEILKEPLSPIPPKELFSLMSLDDMEDVVSA